MKAFEKVLAIAMPINALNVDTDQIIPARFLKKPRSEGYGNFLFYDLRFDLSGARHEKFLLNAKPYCDARILVANANFGCGSSREGAVYALLDYGFCCVIAPSFGDIFYNNSLNNGLLPIRLAADDVSNLREVAAERPDTLFGINLSEQTVSVEGKSTLRFDIDAVRKRRLVNGQDFITSTTEHAKAISRFIEKRAADHPWMMFGR